MVSFMVGTSAPKIAAISFIRSQANPVLERLEELFNFCLFSQLNRILEVSLKDLTQTDQKMGIDPRLNQHDFIDRLRLVATANRTRYTWITQVSQALIPGTADHNFKVSYWLYDLETGQISLENSSLILYKPVNSNQELPDIPPIDIQSWNQAILEVANTLHINVCGERCPEPVGLPPLTNSLMALHYLFQAHYAVTPTIKLNLLESAIAEDDTIEIVHSQLARLYKNTHAYEKCVTSYRKAVQHAHGMARHKAVYATEAGVVCALMHRLDLALPWWLKSIEYDTTYINPYFNIANIYEDQDNLVEAEKYFVLAQRLAPDDFRTYLSLGRIYSKLGSWEKAAMQYSQQLKVEKDDPWCHSDLATCYLNLGNLPKAKEHLQSTVELDPDGEAGQYAQLILAGIS